MSTRRLASDYQMCPFLYQDLEHNGSLSQYRFAGGGNIHLQIGSSESTIIQPMSWFNPTVH